MHGRLLKVTLSSNCTIGTIIQQYETWTVNKALCKRLDGYYTRMLRMAMNISWKQKPRHQQLYETFPRVLPKVAYRGIKLEEYCIRDPEEIVSKPVLWQPAVGRGSVGKQLVSFIDTLHRDANINIINELKTVMLSRDD